MSKAARSTIIMMAFLVLTGLLASGCSSKLIIKSEPVDAEVYVETPGGRPQLMGKTPLELTNGELQSRFGIDPSSGDLLELTLKKENYRVAKYLVPASRLVTVETSVFAKLEPGSDDNLAAKDALQHLSNAQKFCKTREYDRAQVEVDEALKIVPNFPRAYTMRATIYFLQRKYDDSLHWYEEALKLDSNLDEAVRMIGYIKKKSPAGSPSAPAVAPPVTGGKP